MSECVSGGSGVCVVRERGLCACVVRESLCACV